MKEELTASLKQMSMIVAEMVDLVCQGFMENDAHYLNSALNKERILDGWERSITVTIIDVSKGLSEKQRKEFIWLEQTAQNMERMGDELRSLIERMEIKIAERLFFSEDGIKQYKEVFARMRESVRLVGEFLDEGKREVLDKILGNGEQIKQLVEKYRVEHVKRLAEGICKPRAANMYFDMLDFTGNIARHCTNIAKSYKEQ